MNKQISLQQRYQIAALINVGTRNSKRTVKGNLYDPDLPTNFAEKTSAQNQEN